MKIIGTDISLDVCKEEGYMMMEYDARKKFDRTKEYRTFCHFPVYTHLEGFRTNSFYSFDELVKIYEKDKEGLNSSSETDKSVNFDNPDYHDFLNLASDIQFYRGLD